jgi:hypothetical protein
VTGILSALSPVMRGFIIAGTALACALVVSLTLLGTGLLAVGQDDDAQAGATPTQVGASAPDGQIAGREVQPQAIEASEAPPLVPVGGPLIEAPFAASAFAAGELVAGFPVAVMGPIPGADVVETAISSGGGQMQSTLIARTDDSAAEILAHYRDLWTELGRAPSQMPGEQQLAYSGAYDSLTLAVRPKGGTGTVYVITAVFRAS